MKTKTISKKKIKKQLSIQEEIEKDYYRLIRNIDKIFLMEFGKMCPDFEPGCMQCKAHLIYNKFKQELYNELVK